MSLQREAQVPLVSSDQREWIMKKVIKTLKNLTEELDDILKTILRERK